MKLKEYGWGIEKLYTHKSQSGKYCPHRTMDIGWERFKKMVAVEMEGVQWESGKRIRWMGNSIFIIQEWCQVVLKVC